MAGMKDLMREYERARYPADRRLDIHGEGPAVARERALHWIQSRAHEAPGQELLLIVDRTGTAGRGPSPVQVEVRKLLDELDGKLIDWWQPFAPGSLALRIARVPSLVAARAPKPSYEGDGRTPETAGIARPPPRSDIPRELLDATTRLAELRLEREGLSTALLDVVLREVWHEAQTLAMDRRLSFEAALAALREAESARRFDE